MGQFEHFLENLGSGGRVKCELCTKIPRPEMSAINNIGNLRISDHFLCSDWFSLVEFLYKLCSALVAFISFTVFSRRL